MNLRRVVEERRPGLGAELFGAVDEAMVQVCSTPMAAPTWPGRPRHRRIVLRRFPYVLVYEVQAEEVEFVAVAHTSRKPGHWLHRTKKNEEGR